MQTGAFKCWFGGDTGFDETMFTAIGDCLGPVDLALIPIGAYAPRYFMGPQHLDPQQAVKVHGHIRAKRSIPIHWGAFQLTHEPFLEPPRLLKEAAALGGIAPEAFRVIRIGETVTLP